MNERAAVWHGSVAYKAAAAHWRGRCVVANGCFDVLHPGHLRIVCELDGLAMEHRLHPVVLINSDASVTALKGAGRPVMPDWGRAQLITSLRWAVSAVIFSGETPQAVMDDLQPSIVVKGSEYDPESVVRWSGSRVVTVSMLPMISTSWLLGKGI